MKMRIKASYQNELRGSGLQFTPEKGYFAKTSHGIEYFTKSEAMAIARILSSERARLISESYEKSGKPQAARARKAIKTTFRPESFKSMAKEWTQARKAPKSKRFFQKERQRLTRAEALDDYVIVLLIDYFPNADYDALYAQLTPEKEADMMAMVISPFTATAHFDDPEEALRILGFSPDDPEVSGVWPEDGEK